MRKYSVNMTSTSLQTIWNHCGPIRWPFSSNSAKSISALCFALQTWPEMFGADIEKWGQEVEESSREETLLWSKTRIDASSFTLDLTQP
jgi:hypothetical protein